MQHIPSAARAPSPSRMGLHSSSLSVVSHNHLDEQGVTHLKQCRNIFEDSRVCSSEDKFLLSHFWTKTSFRQASGAMINRKRWLSEDRLSIVFLRAKTRASWSFESVEPDDTGAGAGNLLALSISCSMIARSQSRITKSTSSPIVSSLGGAIAELTDNKICGDNAVWSGRL